MAETDKEQEELLQNNYLNLKELLGSGIVRASHAESLHDAKGILIEVQGHFKGLLLRREDREELYGRLQEAFAGVNRKIEKERSDFENEALSNHADLLPVVREAHRLALNATDMRGAWDSLLQIQNQVKASKLMRQHRDELHALLQEAFESIKARRDEERMIFDREAGYNYNRLKSLVEKGLRQAEETHEYKETREFLKKIQSEFKGIKMTREQREELYSRLQTAFDILGKRLDDYFRHKKKNWEVKMQFTLSRFSADIYELQTSLEKDHAYLKELEDQLEIMVSSGKETTALAGIQARIATTRKSIETRKMQINRLETEKSELQNRLEEPSE